MTFFGRAGSAEGRKNRWSARRPPVRHQLQRGRWKDPDVNSRGMESGIRVCSYTTVLLRILESSRQMPHKWHLPPQAPLLPWTPRTIPWWSRPTIPLSFTISITFNYHKTDIRDMPIMMYHTGKWDLCPTHAWPTIIRSINDLTSATKSTRVYYYSLIFKPAAGLTADPDNPGNKFAEVTDMGTE
jgi:hypothetical protein